jgi:hypothetical protein
VRWLHLTAGIVGVLGFLASGQYMEYLYVRGMDDTRRLLFRSTHIYLLFTSLVNLALGLHLRPASGWRWWLRMPGSLLVLSAPFFAAAGFFIEPWLTDLDRPYTRPAAYGCLAGMIFHLLCWTPGREIAELGSRSLDS